MTPGPTPTPAPPCSTLACSLRDIADAVGVSPWPDFWLTALATLLGAIVGGVVSWLFALDLRRRDEASRREEAKRLEETRRRNALDAQLEAVTAGLSALRGASQGYRMQKQLMEITTGTTDSAHYQQRYAEAGRALTNQTYSVRGAIGRAVLYADEDEAKALRLFANGLGPVGSALLENDLNPLSRLETLLFTWRRKNKSSDWVKERLHKPSPRTTD